MREGFPTVGGLSLLLGLLDVGLLDSLTLDVGLNRDKCLIPIFLPNKSNVQKSKVQQSNVQKSWQKVTPFNPESPGWFRFSDYWPTLK